jgi:hypothetical protein
MTSHLTPQREAIQMALEYFEQPFSTASAWEYNKTTKEVIVQGLRSALSESVSRDYHPHLDGPAEPVGLSMRDENAAPQEVDESTEPRTEPSAVAAPLHIDKKRPLPASDFRLLSESQKYALYAEATRSASGDSARMDWLEMMTVEVRTPLVYGSRHDFYASPLWNDGEEQPSSIRAEIDKRLGSTRPEDMSK